MVCLFAAHRYLRRTKTPARAVQVRVITRVIPKLIQRGDKTHTQDQEILPVSLSTTNITVKKTGRGTRHPSVRGWLAVDMFVSPARLGTKLLELAGREAINQAHSQRLLK